MGYLTPVLMYNDSVHMMKDDPYFTENLYEAFDTMKDSDVFLRGYKKTWFDKFLKLFGLYRLPSKKKWRGSSDFAQVLRSKHADDTRVLVVYGNTWADITEYYWDKKYNDCHDNKKKYIKDCINIAERHIKNVKKAIKEYEQGNDTEKS